jgi:hypothetical protein
MKLNVIYYASHLMALKEIMLLLKNNFQLWYFLMIDLDLTMLILKS